MVDTSDIQTNLANLGLSEKEIECYLALLNNESLSMVQLARAINIPRSSVYRICEDLVSKKFARWVIRENGKDVAAILPEALTFIIDEKREELEKAQRSLASLKMMVGDIMTSVPKTQVRYYQGVNGIKQMIWNCLAAEDEIIGYSQFGRREVVGDIFYNRYVDEFVRRQIRDRAISNQNCLKYVKGYVLNEKHQQSLDDIRIIPKDVFYVSGDNSIYNNIYSVCYWSEGEVVGIEIENAELVRLQKSMFELLWNIAKPVRLFLKQSKKA